MPAAPLAADDRVLEQPGPSLFSGPAPWRGELAFAAVITAAFLFVTLPVMQHHEMWRDELQAWMLARDAPSIGALFHSLRYEGHPALWYLILRPMTRVFHDPWAMQLFCVLLGAMSVFVFALTAPFPRLIRGLFAFGYFVVYGFTIVARSYTLEMFLAVLLCALLAQPRPRLITVGIVMFLFANTVIYGAFIVGSLLVALAVDALVRGRLSGWYAEPRKLIMVMIAGTGVLVSVVQVRRPSDAPFNGGAVLVASETSPGEMVRRMTPVWRAYVPITLTTRVSDLRETNILADQSFKGTVLAVVGSIVMVGIAIIFLRRSVLALTFYLLSTGVLMAFSLLIYFGSLYHHGHYFLVLIMALWLAPYTTYGHGAASVGVRSRQHWALAWLDRYSEALVALLLLCQVVGGVMRLVGDYMYASSGGRGAAEYIRDHGLDRLPVAAYPGFKGTTVAGYLGRPIFALDRGRRTTYTPLNIPPIALDDTAVVAAVGRCCLRNGSPAVLVTDHPLKASDRGFTVEPLAHFATTIILERFYLYLVSRAAQGQHAVGSGIATGG